MSYIRSAIAILVCVALVLAWRKVETSPAVTAPADLGRDGSAIMDGQPDALTRHERDRCPYPAAAIIQVEQLDNVAEPAVGDDVADHRDRAPLSPPVAPAAGR